MRRLTQPCAAQKRMAKSQKQWRRRKIWRRGEKICQLFYRDHAGDHSTLDALPCQRLTKLQPRTDKAAEQFDHHSDRQVRFQVAGAENDRREIGRFVEKNSVFMPREVRREAMVDTGKSTAFSFRFGIKGDVDTHQFNAGRSWRVASRSRAPHRCANAPKTQKSWRTRRDFPITRLDVRAAISLQFAHTDGIHRQQTRRRRDRSTGNTAQR